MTDPNPPLDHQPESNGDGGIPIPEPGGDLMHQDEDVLRDVLDELDRERTRRAELEAQVRSRVEENQSLKSRLTAHEELAQKLRKENEELKSTVRTIESAPVPAVTKPDSVAVEREVTRHAFASMETQVKEFQQLVDALTLGRPAIALAARQSSTPGNTNQQWGIKPTSNKTLPLHVVRLLEILPWTPHAYEHVFAKEDIFEWQFYDTREQQWTSNLRIFPQYFKSMPMVRPKPGKDQTILGAGNADLNTDSNVKPDGRGLLVFLAGGGGSKQNGVHHHSPSKHGVLSNEDMTQLLSIENGYPLPEDGGTWEWIGGWRIEKRVTAGAQQPTQPGTLSSSAPSSRSKVDVDEQGWSYAKEVEHFKTNPTELVWDNPGEVSTDDNASNSSKNKNEKQQSFTRCLRRRKWTRQRVLTDYPQACDFTKQYLKLLAENARLTVTTNKISDQLVETKTSLTENEETLMNEKSSAAATIARMEEELTQLRKTVGHVVVEDGGSNQMGNDGHHSNPLQEFLQKNEQQVKGLGSKFQQWVSSRGRADSKDFESRSRSNSKDMAGSSGKTEQATESPAEPASSSLSEQQTEDNGSPAINVDSQPKSEPNSSTGQSGGGFDWSKVTGGGLFQKLNRNKDGRESENNGTSDNEEEEAQTNPADLLKLGETARNTEGSSSTDDENSVEEFPADIRQETLPA